MVQKKEKMKTTVLFKKLHLGVLSYSYAEIFSNDTLPFVAIDGSHK